jgi:hypothetical protein
MKNIFRIIGVSLASMAGILLVSGVAWAQALKTPIEGRWENCRYLGEPEREWVDSDGISHVRGQSGECSHVGDIRGRIPARGERFVANWDDDIAGETWFEHGTTSFTGRILGEWAPATGHYTLDCTGPFQMQTCILELVWHLEDGRLLKTTTNWVEGDGDPTHPYTGILLDPPGGEKRNGPRRRK